MKTRLLLGAAVVAAAIPAVIGLWGNASFSQDLPVRVPASGQVVSLTPTPASDPGRRRRRRLAVGVVDHGADSARPRPSRATTQRRAMSPATTERVGAGR